MGHAGVHDFTSLIPLRGYFRFYRDYEVYSRGAKPPVESLLFDCRIIAVRDGVHVILDLDMPVSASDCSSTQEALLQHVRQATRLHQHALLTASLRRQCARTLYARIKPMGASGLRERRIIFSTYIGASVHPMSLKTLSVCTRWVYLMSVIHPMSHKALSVRMRWDYLRSIVAPDVSRKDESRFLMHNAQWAMLGVQDFTSMIPLRGCFRIYFDYEVKSRGAKPLSSHCYFTVTSSLCAMECMSSLIWTCLYLHRTVHPLRRRFFNTSDKRRSFISMLY